MQLTLHVTRACNLRCTYCYFKAFPAEHMPEAVALGGVEVALGAGAGHLAVTWFGGEPLLRKDTIQALTPRIRALAAARGRSATFKIPTNGHLLDEEFLAFCEQNSVFISLSIDGGEAANADRVDPLGRDGHARTWRALELLVRRGGAFATYSVVTPRNVDRLEDSIRGLYSAGSRILIVAIDHGGAWDEDSMARLADQYRLLGRFWAAELEAGRPLFLSPFDSKVEGHTRPDPVGRACHAGVTQLSVAPDGTIFPCVQFLDHPEFAIGHVSRGLDEGRVQALFGDTHVDHAETCGTCAIRGRCGRDCTCVRFQASGDVHTISAVACHHERVLTPIADAVARDLYNRRVPLFVQQHYNPAHHPLRAIEALIGQSVEKRR